MSAWPLQVIWSPLSLAYAVGAPVMAVLTAGLELRRLLAVAMGAALAPGDAGLLAARLVLALSAATFMPAANGYVAALGELSGVVALCRWSGTG
jgi:predicted MFS family arabinose efflux permease